MTELSEDSKKILKNVREIYHIWVALNERINNNSDGGRERNMTYMRQKYDTFISTKLGTQLFFQIKWFIDNNQEYDFDKLVKILMYRDRIQRQEISSEDASAHFEYSMQKKHAYKHYDREHKDKIDEEYQDRFKDKSDKEKQNLFLDPPVANPIKVEVKINESNAVKE